MAIPVFFQGSNAVLKAPPGQEDEVIPLPVLSDTTQVVSCWKLSEQEIEYIKEHGVVWLAIAGHTHAPVVIKGEAMVTFEGFHPEIKDIVIGGEGNG